MTPVSCYRCHPPPGEARRHPERQETSQEIEGVSAMTSRFPASRVLLLAFAATALLTGCKKADAPQFSPSPGTYTTAQSVSMTSTSLGATIVYTIDGSAPSCVKQHGTIYSAPVV